MHHDQDPAEKKKISVTAWSGSSWFQLVCLCFGKWNQLYLLEKPRKINPTHISEELSETEFTDHADTAGLSTAFFFFFFKVLEV